MKIVVLDGYGLNPGDISWDEFYDLEHEVKVFDTTEPEDVIERIGDAEILIVNKIKITEDIMREAGNIKYIGVLATGYDIVDVKAAEELGIAVTNIPGYGTQSVAQFVFALLLDICNQAAYHNKRVKEGAWKEYNEFCFWEKPLVELWGKTIGIIGYGKIGKATARIARAFGMEVLINTLNSENETLEEGMKFVKLEELYKSADVISLHCPLFNENRGMINKESISKMKDGVVIINTSRGGLIVENDLAEALECGKVAAAGLDAMIEEPPANDNVLIHAKNCVVTPHIAWAPKESRERLMHMAVENIKAFESGAIKNRVV